MLSCAGEMQFRTHQLSTWCCNCCRHRRKRMLVARGTFLDNFQTNSSSIGEKILPFLCHATCLRTVILNMETPKKIHPIFGKPPYLGTCPCSQDLHVQACPEVSVMAQVDERPKPWNSGSNDRSNDHSRNKRSDTSCRKK